MQYRRLGQNGLKVSVISFGAWQIGDPSYWGTGSAEAGARAVSMALDAGITLFDTAEMYGNGESERVLGQALGKRSEEVMVASKVSPENCTPEGVRRACENSLRRLNRSYIDLYQIHWPFPAQLFGDVQEELDKLRSEGKIREVGLSNFGPKDLGSWMERGAAVSNQLGYNMLFRAVEYGAVPECRKWGVGVLAYMPLMQGLLTGRWKTVTEIPLMRRRTRHFSGDREGTRHGEAGCEGLLMETVGELRMFSEAIRVPLATVSLCWLLAQPGVTSVICGVRDPEQLGKNLQAADLNIGPAAVAQLNEITAELKRTLGANADMWNGARESRIG